MRNKGTTKMISFQKTKVMTQGSIIIDAITKLNLILNTEMEIDLQATIMRKKEEKKNKIWEQLKENE